MEFESRPIQIQIFQEEVIHAACTYQLAQFLEKFWAKSPDFFPNFLKFESIFGSNLGKFWKINPFTYQILHFIRGHSYTKGLILLPMLAAHSPRVFYTGYSLGTPLSNGIHENSALCPRINKREKWRLSGYHLIMEDDLVCHQQTSAAGFD